MKASTSLRNLQMLVVPWHFQVIECSNLLFDTNHLTWLILICFLLTFNYLNQLLTDSEFDSPAHAGSLCKVYDICMDRFCTRSSSGLLDPRKKDALPIVHDIYREVLSFQDGLFDDEYVMIGHDEADYKKCYRGNTKLFSWIRDHVENVVKVKKRNKRELGVYYYFLLETYKFLKVWCTP